MGNGFLGCQDDCTLLFFILVFLLLFWDRDIDPCKPC